VPSTSANREANNQLNFKLKDGSKHPFYMSKNVITYIAACLISMSLAAQPVLQPPGDMVEVNGYKLHLMIKGEGGPTVVLFHGAGDIGLIWNLVLPKVSEFTRAIAIDQAGEGWSQHGHAIHMWQQAYDTHTALHNAGIEGPYILVGHSLGGLLTRVYTQMYPDEVAGVVLVDATHPDVILRIYQDGKPVWKRMRETSKGRVIPAVVSQEMKIQPALSAFQGKRDFGDMLSEFSIADRERFDWVYNQRPFTYVKGRSSFEAETMQLIFDNPEAYDFDDKPLIVISKGIWTDKEGDAEWTNEELRAESERQQKDLLNLSVNSQQVVAQNSGHQIHLDQPDLVAEMIRQMVEQMRNR
jgi:pimeloyl-ACP methyl ester carboxylesterase